jgi:hypothetical protein
MKSRFAYSVWFCLYFSFFGACVLSAVSWPLKISPNGRYLTEGDGTPFFFLCDTAWQLTGRIMDPEIKKTHTWATSMEQMHLYMDDCAEKGFSVIHFVLLKEFEPMSADMITHPDDEFFDRCVEYVAYAQEKGLAVNLIPAWMGWSGHKWAKVFEELEESEIRAFGRYVADKFGDYPNVIYSVGGDCGPYVVKDGEVVVDMLDEARWLGETLKREDPDALCMYFSQGKIPSSQFFHESDWCDFNFVENKGPDSPQQYMDVVRDYQRTPVKPTYMGEFAYEYEFSGQKWPPIDAYVIRRSAYWNLLSGSFGYTYGRRGLWHFNHSAEGLDLPYKLYKPWEELLDCEKSPGRCNMAMLADTFRSFAWHKLVPNHALVKKMKLIIDGTDGLDTMDFVASAVAEDGSFAVAYFPQLMEKTFNLSVLAGNSRKAFWKDPASGRKIPVPAAKLKGTRQTFSPPVESNASGDHDWLLIITAGAN